MSYDLSRAKLLLRTIIVGERGAPAVRNRPDIRLARSRAHIHRLRRQVDVDSHQRGRLVLSRDKDAERHDVQHFMMEDHESYRSFVQPFGAPPALRTLPRTGENRWLAGSCLKATKDHADIKRIEFDPAANATSLLGGDENRAGAEQKPPRCVVTLPLDKREMSAPQELSGRCDCSPPGVHRLSAKHTVRLG